jgi:TrmH family RNA methyltransferase
LPALLTSQKNPLLKRIRRAAAQGSLTEDGFALAEGPHLLEEALRSGVEIAAVIAAESAPVAGHPRLVRVPDRVFATLAATENPQGVLTLVRPPAWTMADILRGPAPLAVILDRLQDPGNAGAILRAAEAFGATGAIFLKGTVNPHNPKCIRASAGSVFRLPLVCGVTEADLPELPLYAADRRAATRIDQADFTAACALIVGSEGSGVSPILARRATGVRIPIRGVESLNAAVAAGICLYEARRQRGAP